MKKIGFIILGFIMLFSSFSYAEEGILSNQESNFAETSTEETMEELISVKDFNYIEKQVKKYLKKYKVDTIPVEEVQILLDELGYGHLKAIYEPNNNIEIAKTYGDLFDAVMYEFNILVDTPNLFTVELKLTNMDIIDIHDRYSGVITALREVAPGTNVLAPWQSIPYGVPNISPGSYVRRTPSVVTTGGYKVKYTSTFFKTDAGKTSFIGLKILYNMY